MENVIGPVLSDKEFFDTLKTEIPELDFARISCDSGDNAKARHIFAQYVRKTISPETYFSIPSKTKKPEMTDALRKAAEKAVSHEMWSVGTSLKFEGKVDWFANPTYNQYREWTWQLSRHSELNTLASAYRATGDERYAEACTELFDSWVKQAVRPEPDVPGGATLCWRTIECGIRMGLIWQDIIHSLIGSPAFTDDIITDWYKSIYEHAIRLRTRYTSGNWLIHELNGLAHIGILYPVFKDSEEWCKFAFDSLQKELDSQIYPDGFQFELSTRYQIVVINHYMSVIGVAKAYNYPIPELFLTKVESMLMVYLKLSMADGRVPDINDGGHSPVKNYIRGYEGYFPENRYFRWATTEGAQGEPPDYNSLVFPYAGMAVFRSGWGKNDVSGFFDAGPFGAGHQHEDKLNLLIYANGRDLLAEGNTYAYDSSDIRSYVLSTRAHNTIRVNGLDQNRRKCYKWQDWMISEPSDIRYEETDRVVYAGGRYSEGYGPEQAHSAVHDRTVVFVKKPKSGQPYFAVLDRLTGNEENSYESIWHFDVDKAELTDCGIKSDYITAFICGDVGEMKIVSGINGPEAQGWICPSDIQGTNVAIPTLIHTVKGRDITTVTVFSVHDGVESPVSSVSYDGVLLTVDFTNGESESIAL